METVYVRKQVEDDEEVNKKVELLTKLFILMLDPEHFKMHACEPE